MQSLEDYINSFFIELGKHPEFSNTYSIEATDFSETNRNLKIVPNGENGSFNVLDLMPVEYKQNYINSGLGGIPIQAQPNFNGLEGLRNLFTYLPANMRSHPKIRDIAHYLENQYQIVYQEKRLRELDEQFNISQCEPKPKKIPNKGRFFSSVQDLVNLTDKNGQLIFVPGALEALLDTWIFVNGRATRKIIDLVDPRRKGKSLEIIYSIIEFGFNINYQIIISKPWETRKELILNLPGNKAPSDLAIINLEQILFVPKLTESAEPCPKCGNKNNLVLSEARTRAADEFQPSKYLCGNVKCRKVWSDE